MSLALSLLASRLDTFNRASMPGRAFPALIRLTPSSTKMRLFLSRATTSAIVPSATKSSWLARFGSLSLKGNNVIKFQEKKQLGESWINGGFFVVNPEFFKFLKDDKTVLEKEPLESITNLKKLKAYKHEGFWQCMDHKLDKDYLEQLIVEKKAPWIIWSVY